MISIQFDLRVEVFGQSIVDTALMLAEENGWESVRLHQIAEALHIPLEYQPSLHESMLREMQGIASKREMELNSCAEELNLSHLGIKPGKCIDDKYIREVFDIDVTHKKDKGQREACGCVESRDIGVYDTCILGCQYCYATSSFDKALINYQEQDKEAPSLINGIEYPVQPNA